MQKRLLFIFAVLLVLVVAERTFAQAGSNSSSGRATVTTSTEQVETAAERQQRLRRIENDENVQSAVDPIRAQREIERQERLQTRCEEVGSNLEQYRTRFSQGAQQYLGAFTRMSAQLESVEERLRNSGSADTTTLQQQLVELREMITAFEGNKDLFVSELTSIHDASCSDADASTRTQVQQSRQQLQALRTEARAIRSYIQNTIRPELQRLRLQLETSTTISE